MQNLQSMSPKCLSSRLALLHQGLRAAAAIGDDTLQERARGYVNQESFTHGTSEQRVRWFMKGLETGDPDQGDTFENPQL